MIIIMNSSQIENGIYHLYKMDKKMAKIIDSTARYNLKPEKNYYYSLLRSIIGQQLSILAAASIKKKFFDYFENKPLPEEILIAPVEVLRGLGLSYGKIKYVKDLSEKIINKEIHFRGLNKMSDQEIIAEYTRVKGIGEWTVHMFLIFTLGRLNVLPVTDLGIRKAIQLNYGLRALPEAKKIIAISRKNNWAPYNSIASWYLWRSLDQKIIVKKV
jgi:DNA-3-methyladenine glycosylase II